jgi:hypothetical protein
MGRTIDRGTGFLLSFLCLAPAACDGTQPPGVLLTLKKIPGWTLTADDAVIRPKHKIAALLYERPPDSVAVWWGIDGSGGSLLLSSRYADLVTAKAVERGTTANNVPPTLLLTRIRSIGQSQGYEIDYEFEGRKARYCQISGPDRWYAFEFISDQGRDSSEADRAFDQIIESAKFRGGSDLSPILLPVSAPLALLFAAYRIFRLRRGDRPAISS